MSQAPATPAPSSPRQRYHIEKEGFRQKVEDVIYAIRLLTEMYKAKGRQVAKAPLVFNHAGRQVSLSGRDLSTFRTVVLNEIKNLGKYFTGSVGRRKVKMVKNEQGELVPAGKKKSVPLFLISSQLYNWLWDNVLQDPVIAALPRIDIVKDRRIASLGIIVSLFSYYINKMGLDSKRNPNRVHFDASMERAFGNGTNTRWIYGDQDWSNNPATTTDASRVAVLDAKRALINQSGVVRVSTDYNKETGQPIRAMSTFKLSREAAAREGRTERQEAVFIAQNEVQAGNDDWGILRRGIMKLLNYYLIPNDILNEQQRAELKSRPDAKTKQETNPIMLAVAELQGNRPDKKVVPPVPGSGLSGILDVQRQQKPKKSRSQQTA